MYAPLERRLVICKGVYSRFGKTQEICRGARSVILNAAIMRLFFLYVVLLAVILGMPLQPASSQSTAARPTDDLAGFIHPSQERAIEARFLAVPDPKLAEEHLRIL